MSEKVWQRDAVPTPQNQHTGFRCLCGDLHHQIVVQKTLIKLKNADLKGANVPVFLYIIVRGICFETQIFTA
jgi:hypothetical protein